MSIEPPPGAAAHASTVTDKQRDERYTLWVENEFEADDERAAIASIEEEAEVRLPPSDPTPPIEVYAADGARGNGHRRDARDDEASAASRFDPHLARVRANLLDVPPDSVERIAGDILRRTAGVRIATGSTGKSTLTLHEMINIILCRELYGHEVMRPGPCVLLTAEDERAIVEYRLWRMMEDMRLSRPQREQVIANLYIEDMTATPCRFVDLGENGALVQTLAVLECIDRYSSIKPTLVSVDPMNLFGPGERFVNDGEGELMRVGRRISAGLNAAVRFEHHTGKNQARDRNIDQYTGRGGSAGADNARFVHVLQVHDAADKLAAPKRCTPEDIAKGNVLRLHVVKDSYGARIAAPIWILRTGFLFTHVKPDPIEDVDPMEEQLKKLYAFIETEETNGIRHTANSLDSRLKEIALSRQELRATLHVAIERKHLLEQALPKGEQSGRRKTYLARGLGP
jgi:regulatory protein RepA